jgi:integrase
MDTIFYSLIFYRLVSFFIMLYTLIGVRAAYRNTAIKEVIHMKKRLTQSIVAALDVTGKRYWITDAACENLRLHVGASGGKTWYVQYRDEHGKHQSRKLGSADALTVAQAREMALDVKAKVAKGEDVKRPKPQPEILTLSALAEKHYIPWVLGNRKSGAETARMLRTGFSKLFSVEVAKLTALDIENWRSECSARGCKSATTNRMLTALKAMLNWAVELGILAANPLGRIKRLAEVDSEQKVRYLTVDERQRLYAALEAREERIRKARRNHIEWQTERDYEPSSELSGRFADYLRPIVLLSLNTGIRRGSVFGLRWGDIDFQTRTLTLRGDNIKSGQVTRLPLNSVALDVLTAWREQSTKTSDEDLVFPSADGKELNNVRKSWAGVLKAAGIKNFRWHDMRHDFASQLVMRGNSLMQVSKLLGHADIKMTMRYAHLTPEAGQAAVESLCD